MWSLMIFGRGKYLEGDCWWDMTDVKIWAKIVDVVVSVGNFFEGDC